MIFNNSRLSFLDKTTSKTINSIIDATSNKMTPSCNKDTIERKEVTMRRAPVWSLQGKNPTKLPTENMIARD